MKSHGQIKILSQCDQSHPNLISKISSDFIIIENFVQIAFELTRWMNAQFRDLDVIKNGEHENALYPQ